VLAHYSFTDAQELALPELVGGGRRVSRASGQPCAPLDTNCATPLTIESEK
jgi:hypothetical protein